MSNPAWEFLGDILEYSNSIKLVDNFKINFFKEYAGFKQDHSIELLPLELTRNIMCYGVLSAGGIIRLPNGFVYFYTVDTLGRKQQITPVMIIKYKLGK